MTAGTATVCSTPYLEKEQYRKCPGFEEVSAPGILEHGWGLREHVTVGMRHARESRAACRVGRGSQDLVCHDEPTDGVVSFRSVS